MLRTVWAAVRYLDCNVCSLLQAIRRALQSGDPAADGISIGSFAKAGVPNFLCWSDLDKLHQEFASAGFGKIDWYMTFSVHRFSQQLRS